MLIKSIFKELFKKKLSSVLILTQLVITVIILVYSYDSIRMLNYPKEQLKLMFGDNYKNIYQLTIKNTSDSGQFGDSFNKFNNKLKQTFDEESIGGFHLTNTEYAEIGGNTRFRQLRKKLTKGTFKELSPEVIELYTVDYSIYKLMHVNIEAGRGLNKEDFVDKQNYIIPMVISKVYKGIINLNDIFTSRLDNRKYKVVGFFNEDLKWLDQSSPVSSKLVSLNDKVITPYIIDKNDALDTVIKSQAYYFINTKGLSDGLVKSDIRTMGKEFNLNLECISLEDQLKELNSINGRAIFYSMLIAVFFTIVSCLGLSIIMYYSVNLRKSEFGIRIVCGGNKNYIRWLVVGEITTLTSIAFLISSIILSKLRKETTVSANIINLFDIRTTIFIFVFLTVFSIVSCILPLKRISKLSPKELIGGAE